MLRVLGLSLGLICFGCAHGKSGTTGSEPQIDPTKEGGTPGWECREERQLGSMISRNVCRRTDHKQQDQNDATLGMDSLSRGGAKAVGR
jgi:hypothetical protein